MNDINYRSSQQRKQYYGVIRLDTENLFNRLRTEGLIFMTPCKYREISSCPYYFKFFILILIIAANCQSRYVIET